MDGESFGKNNAEINETRENHVKAPRKISYTKVNESYVNITWKKMTRETHVNLNESSVKITYGKMNHVNSESCPKKSRGEINWV